MESDEASLAGTGDPPFVSYSQNFEDVMLWRPLREVERGFYIDIGAQDPCVDSVSRAFYEHGWKGVHVEPVGAYADRLRSDRPDEEVLEVAVSDRSGELNFFEIEGTGLSTAVEAIAQRHAASGFKSSARTVTCITLDSLFAKLGDREVHWLKIDVEGYEERVLGGWGGSNTRPWIVVIESTTPLSSQETSDRWETTLLELGYEPAYFDGLNRFYVSTRHRDLKDALRIPPNVFDRFELSGTSSSSFAFRLKRRIDSLADVVHSLKLDVTQRDQSIAALIDEVASLRDRAGRAEATWRLLDLAVRQRDASIVEVEARREAERQRANELETVRDRLARDVLRRDDSIAGLERAIAIWVDRTRVAQSRADQFEALYRWIEGSRSWRYTGYVRRIVRGFRTILGVLGNGAADAVRLPPQAIRVGLLKTLVHLRAHPRQRAVVARAVSYVPAIDRSLRTLAARQTAANRSSISIDTRSCFDQTGADLWAEGRDIARRLDYVTELEARVDELQRAIIWDEGVRAPLESNVELADALGIGKR